LSFQEPNQSSTSQYKKVPITVDVPGKGHVFKMRLISTLNIHSPSSLLLDRLRRVQYKVPGIESFLCDPTIAEIVLFDDCGIHMGEGKSMTWYVAHIQKIVKCPISRAKLNYLKPVPLSEVDIKILPKYYKLCSSLCYTYGGYEGQEADLISTSAVIGLVSLKFDGGTGMYTLD
jgi:hypothetical protein